MTPTPDKPAGEALKACPLPWCHGDAETVDFGYLQAPGEHGFAVNCLSPKCTCITPIYGTEADAISAWNTRTLPPSVLDDEVVAVVKDWLDRVGIDLRPGVWRDLRAALLTRLTCMVKGHRYSLKIVYTLPYCNLVLDTCDRCGEGTSDLNLAKAVARAKDSQ